MTNPLELLLDSNRSEEAERLERGIPYHPEVIEWFASITSELGIPNKLPTG